jgi:hypothetical protein
VIPPSSPTKFVAHRDEILKNHLMNRWRIVSLPAILACNALTASATNEKAAEDSPRLPTVMHMSAANCATLELRDGHYLLTTKHAWEPPDFSSIWTVVAFTRKLVVFRRHDSPNPANPAGLNGWDVTYTGQISADGNSLVNITENGAPAPYMHLAWGSALDSVPGSNEERDRREEARINQDGGTGDGSQSITADDALNRGNQALMRQDTKNAERWWRLSAGEGNTEAQFQMGIFYEYGQGGTIDRALAMEWFQKSADHGNIQARDYLVYKSANVQQAIIQLYMSLENDPDISRLQFILGAKENIRNLTIEDSKPVDMRSEKEFSMIVMFSARRSATTTPDSNRKSDTIIPADLFSLAPILQAFTITKTEDPTKYVVRMPYVGAPGHGIFALSRPHFSQPVTGPSW